MMDCRYYHMHYILCMIMKYDVCIMFICRHMCRVIWGWKISKNDGNEAQTRVYYNSVSIEPFLLSSCPIATEASQCSSLVG